MQSTTARLVPALGAWSHPLLRVLLTCVFLVLCPLAHATALNCPTSVYQAYSSDGVIRTTVVNPHTCGVSQKSVCFDWTVENQSELMTYTLAPTKEPCADKWYANASPYDGPIPRSWGPPFIRASLGKASDVAAPGTTPPTLPAFYVLGPSAKVTFHGLSLPIGSNQWLCGEGISNPITQPFMTAGLYCHTFVDTDCQSVSGPEIVQAALKILGSQKAVGTFADAIKTAEAATQVIENVRTTLDFFKIDSGVLNGDWSSAKAELYGDKFMDLLSLAGTDAVQSLLQAAKQSLPRMSIFKPGLTQFGSFLKLYKKFETPIKFAWNIAKYLYAIGKEPDHVNVGVGVGLPSAVVGHRVRIVEPSSDSLLQAGGSVIVAVAETSPCSAPSPTLTMTSQTSGVSKSFSLTTRASDGRWHRTLHAVDFPPGPVVITACPDTAGPCDSQTIVVGYSPGTPAAFMASAPPKGASVKAGAPVSLTWKLANFGGKTCSAAAAGIALTLGDGLNLTSKTSSISLAPGAIGIATLTGTAPAYGGFYPLAVTFTAADGTLCGSISTQLEVRGQPSPAFVALAAAPWSVPFVMVNSTPPFGGGLKAKIATTPDEAVVTLAFVNAGTEPWSCDGDDGEMVYLQATDVAGNPYPDPLYGAYWISEDKVGVCEGGSVQPGGTAIFRVPLTQPASPGTYVSHFAPWHTTAGALAPPVETKLVVTDSAAQSSQPLTASVIAPNGGESLTSGQTFNIAYVAKGPAGATASVFLSQSGKSDVLLAKVPLGAGFLPWIVPNAPSLDSRIRVVVASPAGQDADASDSPFAIAPACVPPPVPDFYTPGDLILQSMVTVNCQSVPTAEAYEFQYGKDAAFGASTTVSSAKSWADVFGISTGTWYFRSRATNACGSSAWSGAVPVAAQINTAPAVASSPTPGNGATGIPLDQVLSWQGGDTDGGTVQYSVWTGTSANNLSIAQGWQTANSWKPAPLLVASQSVYWQVRTKDDGNLITNGPIWSFNTANSLADVAVAIDSVTGMYQPNGEITVNWRATNVGNWPSAGTSAYFYLSTKKGGKEQQLLVNPAAIPALQPGEAATGSAQLPLGKVDAGAAYVDFWDMTLNAFADGNPANDLTSALVSYVDKSPPTLIEVNVNAYAKFVKAGAQVYFTEYAKDDTGIATLDVEWSLDGTTGWTSIVKACVPGTGGWQDTCLWQSPTDFVHPAVYFRFTVTDTSGNAASKDYGPVACIDGTGPQIKVTSPAAGAAFKLGDTVSIAWQTTSAYPIKEVDVAFWTDQMQLKNYSADFALISKGADPGVATYKIPLDSSYISVAAKVRVTAWDTYGNWTQVLSSPIVVLDGTTAPPPWSNSVPLAASYVSKGGESCAVDPAGSAWVTFTTNSSLTEYLYALRIRPVVGGVAGTEETLIPPSTGAQYLSTTTSIDTSGFTTVAYLSVTNTMTGAGNIMAIEGKSKAWSAPVQLSSTNPGLIWGPRSAGSKNGRLVCWSQSTPDGLYCSYGALGKPLGAAMNVGQKLKLNSVVANPDGTFLVVSNDWSGAVNQLRVQMFDGVAFSSPLTWDWADVYDTQAAVADNGARLVVRSMSAGLSGFELSGASLGVPEPLTAAMSSIAGNPVADALGHWHVFSISSGQLFDSIGLNGKWTPPTPILKATEYTNSPVAVCRGLDARIHVVFQDVQYTSGIPVLDTTPPTLSWQSPMSGVDLPMGSTTTISWSTTDASGVASTVLEWAEDSAGPWMPINVPIAAAGTAKWNVPVLLSGKVSFRLTATDSFGLTAVSIAGPFNVVDVTPPSVQLTAPIAGEAIDASQPLTVIWQASDNVAVTVQHVWLSTDGGLNWTDVAEPLPDETSVQVVLPKVAKTNVVVKVTASDATGQLGTASASNLSLFVPNTPPVAPFAPTPADALAGLVAASVNLSWVASDADPATSLSFDVWLAPKGQALVQVTTGLASPTFAVAGLEDGTQYAWKVVASDGIATTESAVWTFTTSVPPPQGLDTLSVLATTPASVSLAWTGPSDGSVLIERAADGTEAYVEAGATSASASSWVDTTVSAHTAYVYRARRQTALGLSDYSPPASAATGNQTPDTPFLALPINGASGIPVDAVLAWTASDPDGDALTTTVYLGPTPTPSPLAFGITATEYAPGTLEYSTVYFWRVQVSDVAGGLAQSAVGMFVTAPPPLPEAPSTLIAVADASQVTLTWDDNSNVENGYRVESFAAGSWSTWTSTAWSSLTLPLPVDVTLLTLRIVAFNETGDSPPSNEATVTVAPPAVVENDLDAGSGDTVDDPDAGSWETLDDVVVADVNPADGGPTVDAAGDAASPVDVASVVDAVDGSGTDATVPDILSVEDADGGSTPIDGGGTAQCVVDADCDDADPCTADACKTGSCSHLTLSGCCKSDVQCASGLKCLSHKCATLACQPCAVDGDCGGNVCVSHKDGKGCAEVCVAEANCPAGYTCKALGGGQTVCLPLTGSCKCAPGTAWYCTADHSGLTLQDNCGNAIAATFQPCSNGCLGGLCLGADADAATTPWDTDDIAQTSDGVATDVLTAPTDTASGSKGGCAAAPTRQLDVWAYLIALSSTWLVLRARRKSQSQLVSGLRS